MFNFKKERLVKDSIGQGSFGEVFPYQKDSQDAKWVVKRTKAKKIEDLLRCLPEIVLGFSCDHPCIVPVKGYSIESKDNKYNVYMKLPRMSGGNLADEIRRRKPKNLYFSEDELVKHFYALVSAVDYLHSKKISHGDIKINNILIDEKGNLKLCDIGSGKYVPDDDAYHTMTAANGAINYKAPEIIQYEKSLRKYKSKSEEEKKAQPMENTLKKDHLYLGDSWSLGLTMLEMCVLESRLVDPHDSTQEIEENLQKNRDKAAKHYSDGLLNIVFGLLKTNPAERFQVSAVRVKLEESFPKILTQDLKAGLGLQKQNKHDIPDISNSFKSLNEKAKAIMKVFEDDARKKEMKLNSFVETIEEIRMKVETLKIEIEKIQAQKKQEIQEISKKYDESIQTLKKENLFLEGLAKESDQRVNSLQEELEALRVEAEKIKSQKDQEIKDICKKYDESIQILRQENFEKPGKKHEQLLQAEKQVLPREHRDENAYKEKLKKASETLEKKWGSQFCFSLGHKTSISFSGHLWDEGLKDITKDLVEEYSKAMLWEDIDKLKLDISPSDFCKIFISDQGLKEFACQIGPKLCYLRHLELNMNAWMEITDDGLKEFAILIAPQLTKVEHFVLNINAWKKISNIGLNAFASELFPKLVSAQYFKLGIYYWEDITDEGLTALASHLGPSLANLKTFDLDLRSWTKITSKSLDFLADQISRNLINLKELDLNLTQCYSVLKDDEDNFRKRLKKIPNISIGREFYR